MKKEEQICLLEQSRRLKALGVNAPSYFTYVFNIVLPSDCQIKPTHETASWKALGRLEDGGVIQYFPMYSAAELSAAIPTHITYEGEQYFFKVIRGSKRWLAEWATNKKELAVNSEGELDRPRGFLWNTYKGNKYLVNVLADWIIALLEENILTAADVS